MKTSELQSYLKKQKTEHLYRSRLIVDGPQGIEITIEGKNYLNFCSNDYLGHAAHPKVVEAFVNGAKKYGTGSGASHLINGHSRVHHDLEERLAEFVQRPRALLFSTGYMANLGVLSALVERGDEIFEDRLNHASLIDGALLSHGRLLRYAHADTAELSARLVASKASNKVIVSDGVFSMDGDCAPLQELAILARQHEAWLMIDDAHGLGVLGRNGRGLLEVIAAPVSDVPILIGTLGKALGTFGAFVAGEDDLIETLIQRSRSYIYTTALPPAVASATIASLKLLENEAWRRAQLHANIARFKQLAAQAELNVMESESAIQPIHIGDVTRCLQLSERLRQNGLLVSAIRPPTVPRGTARLRVTLSAEHTPEHIERLITLLTQSLAEDGVPHE